MVDVLLQQVGESVQEVTVSTWLKEVGELVAKDEPLVEVITDKVNVEMLSDYEGVLSEILVDEGETATIGQVICRIEESPLK